MLNEIFSEYKSSIDNQDKNNKDDFLNENTAIPTKTKAQELMQKYCTLYNKSESIKPMNIQKQQKLLNKEIKNNSAGPLWFNMKAPELTPEIKNDLKALQLKAYIDPFNFKKKNDKNIREKFFQIGTVQDNILDGKNSRLKKSMVKNSIIEEMIDMDMQRQFSSRKFEEYQKIKRKIGIKKAKLNKNKLYAKGKTTGLIIK